MRQTPVIVFINKLDRPSKEPFDLLDEVEKELHIRVRPLAFPISNVILADEPSKGLDEKRVSLVVEAFEQLKEESLLCVTHDMMFAGRISDHICVLYAAQQVEYGPTEEILKNPLHPYTQDMILAIPENGMKVSMTGFAPPHTDYQNYGCRYKHRCRFCTSKCDTMPPVFTLGGRKVRCWKYENEN